MWLAIALILPLVLTSDEAHMYPASSHSNSVDMDRVTNESYTQGFVWEVACVCVSLLGCVRVSCERKVSLLPWATCIPIHSSVVRRLAQVDGQVSPVWLFNGEKLS